ncbi:MAG: riboflavin synthase [Syntrophomonas sp.]|nr:riboflavin synthase [Syntrophomonas sp.]MDD2509737.1 riboflavin synthase [Syntrophomonas sp.]MDD3879071.1 riboflavin synthase [Syntrophomonas sp.]MDD4625869.1 riboflavin synthase [Syntrophomonas sp.]
MFTGLIEEVGNIKQIIRGKQSIQLKIEAEKVLSDVKIGDSIAVNGVCLTVTDFISTDFTCDLMPETMDKTSLKFLQSGSPVNLERALRLCDRLGGHLLQGHVDAIGRIKQKEHLDIAVIFRIEAPSSVLKYTVPKGSIAIDGISLTIIDVFPDSFSVSLIPHSAKNTTLAKKSIGDKVNLESDIIGRYVEKLLNFAESEAKSSDLNLSFLVENGFV